MLVVRKVDIKNNEAADIISWPSLLLHKPSSFNSSLWYFYVLYFLDMLVWHIRVQTLAASTSDARLLLCSMCSERAPDEGGM